MICNNLTYICSPFKTSFKILIDAITQDLRQHSQTNKTIKLSIIRRHMHNSESRET